jgi:hypothetical protein
VAQAADDEESNDADSDEAESCPPEKYPLKNREKPKDPEEAERRKNDTMIKRV